MIQKIARYTASPVLGLAPLFLAALSLLAVLFSCERWPTEERIVSFDVPASLFNAPDYADPGLRGPGIDLLSLSLVCKSGFSSVPFTASLTAADLVPGDDWALASITVSGQLVSATASGSLAGQTVTTADIEEIEEADQERYGGYEGFPALRALKLDWEAGEDAAGNLRILPCPRPAAGLAWDSGPSPGGNTDLGASLLTRQIAIELEPLEYDADGGLSYDLYYALASEDPSTYTTANFPNTYLAYPWDEWWSWEEVTGSAGKKIGQATYRMTRLSGGHIAGAVDGSGHSAVLMDFSAVEGAVAGTWVLVVPLLTRSGLSVPARTLSIELR